LLLSSWI
jgi:hypothetical protein